MAMSTQPSQDVVIRNATRDDLPRVLEILREALKLEASSESQLLGFLRECPEGFLVAQVGDEIAGVTITYIRDGCPCIYQTAAASEFRSHRGVGSRLAAAQLSAVQRLGYSEIETMIRCDNSVAIKTAEKIGLKHVRTIRNFYDYPRGSARLYVKSLRSDGKVSIQGPRLRDRAKNVWGRVVEPRLNRGLHVKWYDTWATVLDNALYELPEMENCPHELFRLIMQNPSSVRKRTALVIEGDAPIAVVGLRDKGRYWEPVGRGVTGGRATARSVAPVREGFLFPALQALGVEVRIGGWRDPPPASPIVRSLARNAVFKLDCAGDFEQYWRDSGQWTYIRRGQRKTRTEFTFEVDLPDSAAWVLRSWADKWRDDPAQETASVDDQLLAAEYYQKHGQYHSFLLLHNGWPVAGNTAFAFGDELVWHAGYRRPEWDRYDAGTCVMELMCRWAAKQGFAKVDLGGWHEYKSQWAPEDGEQWEFRIIPLRQHLREQVTWKARAVPSKLKGLFGWLPGISRAPEGNEDEEVGESPVPSRIAGASKGRTA
jgi:ribosomal protein S18 acetylase RimI-like enzyme